MAVPEADSRSSELSNVIPLYDAAYLHSFLKFNSNSHLLSASNVSSTLLDTREKNSEQDQ